jgi:hypothetical protein
LLTDTAHPTRVPPTLTIEPADATTGARRRVLGHLDELLGELEQANLDGARRAFPATRGKLLRAGLAHPERYAIAELIEIVFETQRRFLRPMSGIGSPAPWGAGRA